MTIANMSDPNTMTGAPVTVSKLTATPVTFLIKPEEGLQAT